jgi:excisionase family DNA binding protein
MSSNIKVQRICQQCSKEFTAKTTMTKYCSARCNSKAYKAKIKAGKVEVSNKQTQRIKTQPIEELKAKEFLTVRDIAALLNCSVRSVYYNIENGTIKATNLGKRITRVKRSELNKLFEQPQSVAPQTENDTKPVPFNTSDCYTLTDAQSKYGISETALQNLIKRNSIPKIKNGKFAYVPKMAIDKLLS